MKKRFLVATLLTLSILSLTSCHEEETYVSVRGKKNEAADTAEEESSGEDKEELERLRKEAEERLKKAKETEEEEEENTDITINGNRDSDPTDTNTVDTPEDPEEPEPEEEEEFPKGMMVTADSLNLRRAPGTNSSLIKSIPRGTSVTALGESEIDGETWIEVEAAGSRGFVLGDYLEEE